MLYRQLSSGRPAAATPLVTTWTVNFIYPQPSNTCWRFNVQKTGMKPTKTVSERTPLLLSAESPDTTMKTCGKIQAKLSPVSVKRTPEDAHTRLSVWLCPQRDTGPGIYPLLDVDAPFCEAVAERTPTSTDQETSATSGSGTTSIFDLVTRYMSTLSNSHLESNFTADGTTIY